MITKQVVPALLLCISIGVANAQESALAIPLQAWSWEKIPDLSTDRELSRMVYLDETHVIIVGGGSDLKAISSSTTEVFDIASESWSAGPNLNVPRRDPQLIKLLDGSILVIGGSDGPTKTGTNSIEILRPNSQKWELVAAMNERRVGHAAALLSDGRVLVTGGQSSPDTFLATTEIYDPEKNTWTTSGEMSEPRSIHHARLLQDGRVLVIGGGTDISATSTTEIFDPNTMTWATVGSLVEPRWGFASAVLDDGRVLIAGGRVPAQKGSMLPEDQMIIMRGAEVFDPKEGNWTKISDMQQPRSMGMSNIDLLRVGENKYMFPGGRSYPAPYNGVASAEVFDTTSGTWDFLAPMKSGRSYFASIVLPQGMVLVAGGRGDRFVPMRGAECFEPPK